MKKLVSKIEELTETIEMGLLTKCEALLKLKDLRSEVAETYEEGSERFMHCIYLLIDADDIAKQL